VLHIAPCFAVNCENVEYPINWLQFCLSLGCPELATKINHVIKENLWSLPEHDMVRLKKKHDMVKI
jgi:hypothetical protein